MCLYLGYLYCMAVSNEHNLRVLPASVQPYGIRVSLPPGDPFARLVGADWHKLHWFASERERDAVLADMASRHPYSRRGDDPSVLLEKITQDATP